MLQNYTYNALPNEIFKNKINHIKIWLGKLTRKGENHKKVTPVQSTNMIFF